MPGYILLESDQDEIPSKYLCSYCGCLLRDPVQTACGHCYCRSCLDNYLLKNDTFQKQCLTCGEFLSQDQVFPDNFIKREVLALKINCLAKNEGCNWKGDVRDLEAHTAVCGFVQVACPHTTCGMMIKKSDLAEHLQSECACRVVLCSYCGEGINANVLEAHTAMCDFVQVACPHTTCGMMIKESDLAEHLQSECARRMVLCSYCREEINADMLEAHQNADCSAYPVECANCHKDVQRSKAMNADDRKKHLKDAVVPHLTLLLALFTRVNNDVQSLMASGAGAASGGAATAVGATESTAAALLNDSEKTIRGLVTQVENVAAENRDLRQKLRDQSDRITSVERRTVSVGNTAREGASNNRPPNVDHASTSQQEVVENVAAENRDPRQQLIDQSDLLTRVGRRTVSLRNTLREGAVDCLSFGADHHSARQVPSDLSEQPGLERVGNPMDDDNQLHQLEQVQEAVRRLERLDPQDGMLALRIVSLADLEEYTSQQKVNSFNGTLLWKISDFARRRNDARTGGKVSFYSSSFFTSRQGYKMCARIYLNGDGMGKGTHISLFFVVMRGQYDALLCWPFRQKVTLMLLDQDNIEHVSYAFRPDPNSSSFQKPRREMNIASGCPLFCPLSDLDKHSYVRDDTMFVKIIVDTSDL